MDNGPSIDVNDWKLSDLRYEFGKKTLVIPQFQRKFVWSARKICELVDSIYKTYPIGSFLIWNSDNKSIFKHDNSVLPAPNPKNNFVNYILDGQQRMASLYGVIFGKTIENSRGTSIDCRKICFDLHAAIKQKDNPEKVCFTYRQSGTDGKRHFSLCEILNPARLESFCDSIGNKTKRSTLRQCRDAFEGYEFSIIEMKNQKEDNLAEAFVRVNDRGVKLGTVNLVVASAWRTDFDLEKNVDEFKSDLPYGFHALNDEHILQTLSLNLKNGFSKTVQLNLAVEWKNWLLSKVESEWKKNSESIEKAIDYLHDNLGVARADFIPFGIMMSMLSCFFYSNRRHSPDSVQARQIEKWFWRSSLLRRYTGSGFWKYVLDDKKKLDQLAEDASTSFELDQPKLNVTQIVSTTISRKNYLRNTFLCLLALKQPRRFDNGKKVNLDEAASTFYDRQRHHIFPRKVLRHHFKADQIDSICNICFIPADLNDSIKDKRPNEYLGEFEKELGSTKLPSILDGHLIPSDTHSEIWKGDVVRDYPKFLESRANLIKNELEKVLR